MFCGLGQKQGSLSTDSCQGDSGGPVLYQNKLIGTVSFGNKCGVDPGVYANIAAGKNWILKRILKKPKYSKKLFKKTRSGIDRPFSKPPRREVLFQINDSLGITKDNQTYQEFFISISANRTISNPKIQVFGSGEFCLVDGQCYLPGELIDMQIDAGRRSTTLLSYSLNSCASLIKVSLFVGLKKYQERFPYSCLNNKIAPKNN